MIYHIIGSMCSGKSTLIKNLGDKLSLEVWDIKRSFYWPLKIIENEKFNFELYSKHKEAIPTIVELFIKSVSHKYDIFIESSGINSFVNKALQDFEVIPILLTTPTEEEIIERTEDNRKRQEAIRFLNNLENTYIKLANVINSAEKLKEYNLPEFPINIEEAYNYIIGEL